MGVYHTLLEHNCSRLVIHNGSLCTVRTLRKQVFDIMLVQRTMLEHYDGGLVVLEWTPYSMPAVGDVMIVHPSLL
jgi:hypothetical protein